MPATRLAPLRIVQSRHNARVKQLRAALLRPGETQIGLEGLHLVEEALRSGLAVETIFVRAGSQAEAEALLQPLLPLLNKSAQPDGPEILAVPDEVLRSAVTTEHPQPIAALAVPPRFSWEDVFASTGEPLLLVLDGVQDPGNVGTMLRSAEAFGASGVLALPGTASVWNAKSLRAAMGSSFRLPVLRCLGEEALLQLGAREVRSLAAVAPAHAGAMPAESADLRGATAVWIGNEGAGLGAEWIAACHAAITLPCPVRVESLNAAVAASVLLYEASCQRAAGALSLKMQTGHRRNP